VVGPGVNLFQSRLGIIILMTRSSRECLSNISNLKRLRGCRSKAWVLDSWTARLDKSQTSPCTSLSCEFFPRNDHACQFRSQSTSAPEQHMIDAAKILAEDLLIVVRDEWRKAKSALDSYNTPVNPPLYMGYGTGGAFLQTYPGVRHPFQCYILGSSYILPYSMKAFNLLLLRKVSPFLPIFNLPHLLQV
jgi:hypothetical protein